MVASIEMYPMHLDLWLLTLLTGYLSQKELARCSQQLIGSMIKWNTLQLEHGRTRTLTGTQKNQNFERAWSKGSTFTFLVLSIAKSTSGKFRCCHQSRSWQRSCHWSRSWLWCSLWSRSWPWCFSELTTVLSLAYKELCNVSHVSHVEPANGNDENLPISPNLNKLVTSMEDGWTLALTDTLSVGSVCACHDATSYC